MRSSLRCVAALAVAGVVSGVILVGPLACALACALRIGGDAGMAAAMLAGIGAIALWHAALRAWRRSQPRPDQLGVAVVSDAPLAQLVAAQARRLGIGRPAQIHVVLGAGVRAAGSGLTIGLGAIAGDEGELRDQVAAALAHRADRLGRAVARTLAVIGDPDRPRLWRAAMARPARSAHRALAGRAVPPRDDFRYDAYWSMYVSPTLAAGYRPPIGEGWRRYLGMTGRGPTPLIADEESVERRLLEASGAPEARELVPIEWQQAAEAVLVPMLERRLRDAPLPAATVSELADAAAGAGRELRERLGAALVLTLRAHGWRISFEPHEHVTATLGDVRLLALAVPFAIQDDRERGRWGDLVDELGLADLPLADADRRRPSGDALLLAYHAALPGAPAVADTVLELRDPPGLRRRVALALGTGVALGSPVAALLCWEAVALDVSPGTRGVVAAMGLGLGGLLIGWVRSRVRSAWSTGRLTVGADRVVIDHPGLLREPWQVEVSRLSAAVVDDGSDARSATRFPFGESQWDGPDAPGLSGGWLWARDDVFAPVLAAPGQTPNLALLFDPPPSGPRVRRVHARGPLPGELLGALLLAVRMPDDAERSLRERGLLRPLTSADVKRLAAIFAGR